MKSYTDLEQSKKLAKFLPIESADMYYSEVPVREWKDKKNPSKGVHVVFKSQIFAIENLRNHEIEEGDIYAWSLSALLSILPNSIYDNTDEYSQLEFTKRSVAYHDVNDGIKVGAIKENLVDAAYEVILKLHKLDLL